MKQGHERKSVIRGIRDIFALLVAFIQGGLAPAIVCGLCSPALSQVSSPVDAAELALEAAAMAEEAAFSPVEVPAAIRAVQRAEALARAAQETDLELDLGLLADDLRMHPTLIRRQAKLVEIDVQRIEDEFDF
ncbi:MAG: hypothetical protein JOY92_13050 [Verrucomicrobia bacterium]|nr:hypothetical protein [Verrucomicrobiota bacterium]